MNVLSVEEYDSIQHRIIEIEGQLCARSIPTAQQAARIHRLSEELLNLYCQLGNARLAAPAATRRTD